jgi:hypothetical protein
MPLPLRQVLRRARDSLNPPSWPESSQETTAAGPGATNWKFCRRAGGADRARDGMGSPADEERATDWEVRRTEGGRTGRATDWEVRRTEGERTGRATDWEVRRTEGGGRGARRTGSPSYGGRATDWEVRRTKSARRTGSPSYEGWTDGARDGLGSPSYEARRTGSVRGTALDGQHWTDGEGGGHGAGLSKTVANPEKSFLPAREAGLSLTGFLGFV